MEIIRKNLKPKNVWITIGLIVVGIVVIVIISLLGKNAGGFAPPPPETPQPTLSSTPTQTETVVPTNTPTITPTPTITFTPKPTVQTTVSEKDGMEMVYVPAGSFMMGSEDGESDERPVHEVYLDAYWIDKYEVNNAQFAQFIKETGYRTDAEIEGCSWVYFEGTLPCVMDVSWKKPRGSGSNNRGKEDYPVIHVSWNDALAYCEWAGRELPTEAQWEKAARGEDGRTYPWEEESPNPKLLNYDRNVGKTSAVGSYPAGASPYEVMDMAGNVWEWVRDWYDVDYYTVSPQQNPQGPASSTYRANRGGSWVEDGWIMRANNRGMVNPEFSANFVGFRCAKNGTPP